MQYSRRTKQTSWNPPQHAGGNSNFTLHVGKCVRFGRIWQDTSETIPANAPGDIVRRIRPMFAHNSALAWESPSPALSPTLVQVGDRWGLQFTGSEYLTYVGPSALVLFDLIGATCVVCVNHPSTGPIPALNSGGNVSRLTPTTFQIVTGTPQKTWNHSTPSGSDFNFTLFRTAINPAGLQACTYTDITYPPTIPPTLSSVVSTGGNPNNIGVTFIGRSVPLYFDGILFSIHIFRRTTWGLSLGFNIDHLRIIHTNVSRP